jgi:hypothetical protein
MNTSYWKKFYTQKDIKQKTVKRRNKQMKNRLIPEEQRQEALMIDPKDWNEQRRSGRSTGLAMKAIADAMLEPGVGFPLRDHAYALGDKTRGSRNLAEITQDIIDRTGLRFMSVLESKTPGKSGNFFIRYDVFDEE